MKTTIKLILLTVLLSLGACANKCSNPEVHPVTYSSPDVLFSSETVYSIVMTVKCSNNEAPPTTLYGYVNGEVIMVTQSNSDGNYQVSWSIPHDKAPKGSITVSFYDDEGASNLRKSLRYGEEVNITPLFAVDLYHKGVKTGSYIDLGLIAVTISLLIWYLAYTERQKIME